MIQLGPPTEQDIRQIMDYIIIKENLEVTPEAKEYLWTHSEGSLRVLINYLEKIFIYGDAVSLSLCKQICSTISAQKFENYIRHLSSGDLRSAIDELYSIYDEGYSVIDILDYFYVFLKSCDLTEDLKYRIVPIVCKYITIFNKLHEDAIELAFFTNQLFCQFITEK
jgi:DNA polymerase III gamma/tau subunit